MFIPTQDKIRCIIWSAYIHEVCITVAHFLLNYVLSYVYLSIPGHMSDQSLIILQVTTKSTQKYMVRSYFMFGFVDYYMWEKFGIEKKWWIGYRMLFSYLPTTFCNQLYLYMQLIQLVQN